MAPNESARRIHAGLIATPVETRQQIFEAFKTAGGNVTRAASLLGISHRTLCRLVARDPAIGAELARVRAHARRRTA